MRSDPIALMRKRSAISKRMVAADFRQKWQFKLVVPQYPLADLDIYVRSVSYGATTITGEPHKVGAAVITSPDTAEPVTLNLTARDNQAGDVATWFDKLAALTVNPDGTHNLPKDYVIDVELYTVFQDGTEELRHSWPMWANERGELTESVEEEGFVELSLSFIQYRSL